MPLNKLLNGFLLICVILQCILHPQFENLYACLIVYVGWIFISKNIINESNSVKYPLVTLTFWGLALFYYYTGVFVTLVEGKPLTFNLDFPYLTFTLQFVYLLSLYGAFMLFKSMSLSNRIKGVFRSVNFYYSPTNVDIWILGGIGLLSLVFSNGNSTVAVEHRSAIDRFLEGFVFLSYLPLVFFCIPVGWDKVKTNKWNKIYAFLFFVIVILCAIMTNRRHAIFGYILFPILVWFTNKLRTGQLWSYLLAPKRFVLIAATAYIAVGPVSDFCIAMNILRVRVHDIGGRELLAETWRTYHDKKALERRYRFFTGEQIKYGSIGYTEYYVDNILFNRLCNMKPIDNSVKYMSRLDYVTGDEVMQEKLKDKILYLIPTPILKLFVPDYNKFTEKNYGFHDYLINRGTNSKGGGFRVGGDIGIGFGTLGVFFIPFVILFYGVFFSVLNAFSSKRSVPSIFGICIVFEIFYIFQSNHGFTDDISLLLRLWPQSLIIFLLLVNVLKSFRH